MRFVHRGAALIIVAVGALVGSGSATAATTGRALSPSYLFSIPTASGTLHGPSNRHLTLRLTGTRSYLTRFTDRPLRDASVVANVDFARRFKTYFSNAAPNAVLTYTPPEARIPVSIVLTVGHPRWNARHHTWTFSATRIRRQPDDVPGTTVHINPAPIPDPQTFNSATLLIDGSNPTAGNPIELTGDGIANSLSAFLQQETSSDGLRMSVAVEYSYALTDPDGVALLPVEFTTAPVDLRVAPGSPLCAIEGGVVQWQATYEPSQVDGSYVFDLTLTGVDQQPNAYTVRYPGATNGLVSAACSG